MKFKELFYYFLLHIIHSFRKMSPAIGQVELAMQFFSLFCAKVILSQYKNPSKMTLGLGFLYYKLAWRAMIVIVLLFVISDISLPQTLFQI